MMICNILNIPLNAELVSGCLKCCAEDSDDAMSKDQSEVLLPSSEVTTGLTFVSSASAAAAAHGIEIAVEFKLVEWPTEPFDNDQPIQCPLPEPSILNEKRKALQALKTEGMKVDAKEFEFTHKGNISDEGAKTCQVSGGTGTWLCEKLYWSCHEFNAVNSNGAAVERSFDAPTYNIPLKPMTFTEGAAHSVVILAGLRIAAAAGYKIFGKALERIQNGSQVRVRIGSPITGYGQESRHGAAPQQVPNRTWTDEDGNDYVELIYAKVVGLTRVAEALAWHVSKCCVRQIFVVPELLEECLVLHVGFYLRPLNAKHLIRSLTLVPIC
ncbi:probable mitochondrial import inner membrane translocase subunit tim21 [Phtheirospermum japonicum]|uniref:Mitochondrial import inner membrane translocase subunit Tim21 n=1 Tax=Phtheirospermum japonicum TaxID=374723 RepID=A0A830BLR6_9LAMI|nr:probable mitochondrial import inner membrane translocase subunit tim21 [Phtheirospermum japonicum]